MAMKGDAVELAKWMHETLRQVWTSPVPAWADLPDASRTRYLTVAKEMLLHPPPVLMRRVRELAEK